MEEFEVVTLRVTRSFVVGIGGEMVEVGSGGLNLGIQKMLLWIGWLRVIGENIGSSTPDRVGSLAVIR